MSDCGGPKRFLLPSLLSIFEHTEHVRAECCLLNSFPPNFLAKKCSLPPRGGRENKTRTSKKVHHLMRDSNSRPSDFPVTKILRSQTRYHCANEAVPLARLFALCGFRRGANMQGQGCPRAPSGVLGTWRRPAAPTMAERSMTPRSPTACKIIVPRTPLSPSERDRNLQANAVPLT